MAVIHEIQTGDRDYFQHLVGKSVDYTKVYKQATLIHHS